MKGNQPSSPNKKLILHFDIDHVIRLPVRKNKDLYVYDLCSNWVWGKLQKNSKEDPDLVTGWKLASNSLSKQQPEPQLISYHEYLKQYVKPNEEEWEKLILNLSKGPAGKAKGQIEKTIKNITVSKNVFESLREAKEGGNLIQKKYMQDGKYQILPSFYKALLWLKKTKREFAIFIRSPIKDAHHIEITQELNLFFNGDHPLYNGKNGTTLVKMDGTNKSKNFVLDDSHFHVVYYKNGYVSTFGIKNYYDDKDPQNLKKNLKNNESVKVCESIGQIYSYSHSIFAEGAFIYEINPEKAIFVDPFDYFTQQIYFTADNQSSIYNSLGQKLSNHHNYLQKVDQFELLRDLDYFVKKIEEKEQNRVQEIIKNEKGELVQQDNLEEASKKEQEHLNDSQYLKQNIVPLLEGAIRNVDLFRPQDPIGYIAYYCLKNRQQIE